MAVQPPPPPLRNDLERLEQRRGDDVVVMFRDPRTGAFFELTPDAADLARLFDGTIDCAEVARRFNAASGASLTAPDVEEFAADMTAQGLLAGPSGLRPSPAGTAGPLSRLLFIRLKAFNPDRLLALLEPGVRGCFSRSFVSAASAAILLGAATTLCAASEIDARLPSLWTLRSLILAWTSIGLVVLLHEFAHGLTLKHFGGTVRSMGFLLLYLQPALYCDVTDAYRLSSRAKRLWVTFAGTFFQLFIGAVAAVLWRVTRPELILNQVFFIVMVLTGVQTLFNLNPLIKLDGYYLLVDWLGITNLRARSFSWLRARLASPFLGSKVPPATARERRVFLVYGVAALAYTTLLLGWLFFKAAGFLYGQAGLAGPALLCAGVALPLRARLWAGLGAVFVARGRRRPSRFLWTLLVVAALGAGLYFGRWELRVTAECVLTPAEQRVIRAEIPGVVAAVAVRDGREVRRGDLVFSLVSRDHVAEFSQMDARVDQARAQLALARKGPRPDDVEAARKKLEKARTVRDYERSEAERFMRLFDKGLLAESEKAAALERARVAEHETAVLESELQSLTLGSRPEEIDRLEAVVRELKAAREHTRNALDLVNVTSPIDGTVATPRVEEKVGIMLEPGDDVCTVINRRTLVVEIKVPEREISDVRPGQPVKIKLRGTPEETFRSTVERIAPAANGSSSIVEAYAALDNAGMRLQPGLTGKAKIYCGQRRLGALLTRRLLRYLRVEFLF